MLKLLKYLVYLLFLPLWWLQLLIPRDKNLWVFGAWYGNKYSDNSKSLFEFVSTNKPSIKAIWLTKSQAVYRLLKKQGRQVYYVNSLKGIYYSLRANYVVVSSSKRDVNLFCINGAVKVQLWHGNPIKKISLDDKFSSVNSFFYSKIIRFVFPMIYEYNFNYIVSNAPIFTPLLSSSFNIPLSNVLETGNPRNDTYGSNVKSEFVKKLRHKFPNCKVVFYLPTFRDHKNPRTLFNTQDFNPELTEDFLEKENLVLVNKGHFVDNIINSKVGVRIINLSDKEVEDINILLKDADCLITDYSGVYFDFLLTQKPILFAAFDLEDYLKSSREMYFEYKDVVSGPIISDWEGLKLALKSINAGFKYNDLLKEKNNSYNRFQDSNNSERTFEAINKL